MYSAVSVGGKRLYDLARQGKEVKRPSRTIIIHDLTLLEYNEEYRHALLEVTCSKGSYVRTLFHDIGAALGTGAGALLRCGAPPRADLRSVSASPSTRPSA